MKTLVHLLTGAAAASLIAISPAQAATTLWDGTWANDTVKFGQFGPQNTLVDTGTVFTSSVSGVTGKFVTPSEVQAQRIDQSTGWSGNFFPGATLLWNQGTAGDMVFTFNTPVAAVGAQFQTDFFGAFTAQITTNDGTILTLPGVSNSAGDNSAIFIGAQSTSADITSITFKQIAGAGGNDFAIGNLSLITAESAVPEPGTWLSMIAGLGMVAGAMRRRKQTTQVRFAF